MCERERINIGVMMTDRRLTSEEAYDRLEELCARSEQCSSDLRLKLWKWGISREMADRVISLLVERRFLDDRRFAFAFVRDKVRLSRWGRRKIAFALMSKHVGKEIIEEALTQIDQDEYMDSLRHVIAAKASSVYDVSTHECRMKLYRYGISRGFEPGAVARVIKDMASVC